MGDLGIVSALAFRPRGREGRKAERLDQAHLLTGSH